MNNRETTAVNKSPILIRNLVHKQQNLRFKQQIVALAIAILTLPVLASKTYATPANYQVRTVQYEPEASTETTQSTRLTFVSRRRLPLSLLVETGAGLLLLVGLIAAYLANRKQQLLLPKIWGEDAESTTNSSSTSITTTNHLPASFRTTPLLPNSTGYSVPEDTVEQAEVLKDVTQRLRRSLDLEDLYKTTVKEIRRALKTDRVVVYAFNHSTWEGNIIAESVALGLPQTLRVKIDDPCFRERHLESYKQGRVRAINDIYKEPKLTECYIKLLEQFAVKANLVAPIIYNEKLFGLLIAHQCDHPRHWQHDEIVLFSRLATQVGFTMNQVMLLVDQEAEAERAMLVQEIHLRLQQALDLEDLFKIAVKEIRRALRTDRVIVYRIDTLTYQGDVIAESVGSALPQTLRVKIEDPCFRERHLELYKQGRVRAINDIHQEPGLTECYIKLLDQFAVKAQLVAPIMQNEELFGLLIAHQCDRPRDWQHSEISLFSRLAVQVGFAINQVIA
jgi:GAF domain-containing protein